MKTFFISLLAVICLVSSSFTQQYQPNEYEKGILEFWKKEKFRFRAEELIDRINNPDKYKIEEIVTFPVLQSETGERIVSLSNVVESEVHAAINPTNPNNIVVSPINQNTTNPLSAITCPIYYTNDQGTTWQKSNFVTKPNFQNIMLAGGGDPVLVFDSNGKLYISWINLVVSYITQPENPTQIIPDSMYAVMHYAFSTDGGANFEFDNSQHVGRIEKSRYGQGGNITYMLDKQWMASDLSPDSEYNGNIYMSSMQFDFDFSSPELGSHIMVFTKPANEKYFNTKGTNVTLNQQFMFVQFGAIDVDNEGTVHLIFAGAKTQNNLGLYHASSKDGGKTFTTPKLITNIRGTVQQFGNIESITGINNSRLYPCPYVAIDKSKGEGENTIYLAWSANGVNTNANRGMDIYMSKSTNGGDSWSTPKIVNNHPAGTKIHAFYSSINVSSDGTLLISYYDRRHEPSTASTHYYLAVSKDMGENFSEIQLTSVPMNFSQIGQRNNNFGIGEYNAIVSDGKYAFPVWADGRTNDGNINIYIAKINTEDLSQASAPDEIVSIYSNIFFTHLFPNPANDLISIKAKIKSGENVTYSIHDINGNTILAGDLGYLEIGQHSFDLDLKNLTQGQYFISLTGKRGYTMKKFTILRN